MRNRPNDSCSEPTGPTRIYRMSEVALPVPRVGGQALADGVFMRTGRAWAIARADGSVEVGTFPSSPLARIPVLRVIASLVPGLALGLKALLRPGGRGRGFSRV